MMFDRQGDYKGDLTAYIDMYEESFRAVDRPARIAFIGLLIDNYMLATGERPDSRELYRLGSIILHEELTDSAPNKSYTDELPFHSRQQLRRRYAGEISFAWADEVGIDGRDHRFPTRHNKEKLRNARN